MVVCAPGTPRSHPSLSAGADEGGAGGLQLGDAIEEGDEDEDEEYTDEEEA